jgi:hypothetical protein
MPIITGADMVLDPNLDPIDAVLGTTGDERAKQAVAVLPESPHRNILSNTGGYEVVRFSRPLPYIMCI